ncbi:uncharacterized protein LOC121499664 isoform X2 [Vulpes lagopus]|uniref:uncharacterized protein LOC121499664 isoform X2 n=1 Tax=Vulpes lagopus TaxID=494514 RepID=UPI001BC987BC|nr:uncharacterized protein LOC121499664 isoform X2 [Vulpes lagopus]
MHLALTLYVLNFLNVDAVGKTAAERFWAPEPEPFLYAQWKDPLTGQWSGPDPVLWRGRGFACLSPQKEETPWWLPFRCIRFTKENGLSLPSTTSSSTGPDGETPEEKGKESPIAYLGTNKKGGWRGQTNRATSNLRDSPPGMSPWDYPDCPTVPNWKSSLPVWRECRVRDPETLHPVMTPSLRITYWSKSKSAAWQEVRVRVGSPGLCAAYEHYGYVPPGSLSTPRMIHSDLWKLAAALRPLKTNSTTGPIYPPHVDLYIQACVPRPFLLVVGRGKIDKLQASQDKYQASCQNCVLTNCLPVHLPPGDARPVTVMLVQQPPYVMLPVNITGLWYTSYGYSFAKQLTDMVVKTKRFLGLLVAGIAAFVSLVASATVSSVALSQTIHTAQHVNSLAHNVSVALATQGTIDQKNVARLQGLEEAVEYLGGQYARLRAQISLQCHAGFQHICVTALPYNETEHTWEQVQQHLFIYFFKCSNI